MKLSEALQPLSTPIKADSLDELRVELEKQRVAILSLAEFVLDQKREGGQATAARAGLFRNIT